MTRKQNAQDRNEFQIYEQPRYFREQFEPSKPSPVWFVIGILCAVIVVAAFVRAV